ncbi:hypothetical protein [Peribacillus sp. SI8-4]|uniref:hypothetical protein n=1 Tax=Peribacillus sp. SI8-4 TaxID=3048009 RepID=UPI002552874B|nr:hypothetical protein [Peribacillus sp. SI8-4]
MNMDIGFLFLIFLSIAGLIVSIRYTEDQDKEKTEVIIGAGIFGNLAYLLIHFLPFKVRKVLYSMVCLLLVLVFSIGLWELSKE